VRTAQICKPQGVGSMDQNLRDVVGSVLQSNLAVLGAFIALSPSLPEEQQQKLLESLDTMKKANQALLDLMNDHKGK
jgi:hypothetical protein